MADPTEAVPTGGDLEAARGFVGRLSLLTAALRGEAQADPQTLVDGLAAGLRQRGAASAGPLSIELSDRGFALHDVDLGMHDLVSAQLAAALRGQGLRRLRIFPSARHEDLVALGHLLAQDWANRRPEQPALDAELWALGSDGVQADFDPRATVSALDLQPVGPAARAAAVAAQVGWALPAAGAPGAAAVAAWFARGPGAPPPSAPPPPPAPPSLGAVQAILPELALEGEPEALPALAAAAARALRTALTGGALAEALAWVGGLAALVEPDLPIGAERRAAVLEALRAATTGADSLLGEALQRGLERHPKDEGWAGAVFALTALQLQLGGEAGVEGCIAEAAALPEGPLRQAAADALALSLGAAPLLLRIKTAPAKQLPSLLLALRRHADPTMVVQITARLSHEDPAVRAAALVAAREQRGPRLTELVLHAIDDPALRVRLEALRYLSAHRLREAAPPVLARLQTASEPEELRALALSYAMITSGQGIAELVGVATGGQARGRAAMQGLLACGPPGRAALDQLGRRWPELRPDLRDVLGAAR